MSVGFLASVVSATSLGYAGSSGGASDTISLNVDALPDGQPVALAGATDSEPGFGGAIRFGIQTKASREGFVTLSVVGHQSTDRMLTETPALVNRNGVASANLSALSFGGLPGFSRESAEFVFGLANRPAEQQKVLVSAGNASFSGQPAVRDLRHTNTQAPGMYLFVSAQNQALVWGIADKRRSDGMALRDQLTIGDVQMGLAWASPFGGRTALGVVERRLKYNDRTGDHDVSERERFAAISYSLRL